MLVVPAAPSAQDKGRAAEKGVSSRRRRFSRNGGAQNARAAAPGSRYGATSPLRGAVPYAVARRRRRRAALGTEAPARPSRAGHGRSSSPSSASGSAGDASGRNARRSWHVDERKEDLHRITLLRDDRSSPHPALLPGTVFAASNSARSPTAGSRRICNDVPLELFDAPRVSDTPRPYLPPRPQSAPPMRASHARRLREFGLSDQHSAERHLDADCVQSSHTRAVHTALAVDCASIAVDCSPERRRPARTDVVLKLEGAAGDAAAPDPTQPDFAVPELLAAEAAARGTIVSAWPVRARQLLSISEALKRKRIAVAARLQLTTKRLTELRRREQRLRVRMFETAAARLVGHREAAARMLLELRCRRRLALVLSWSRLGVAEAERRRHIGSQRRATVSAALQLQHQKQLHLLYKGWYAAARSAAAELQGVGVRRDFEGMELRGRVNLMRDERRYRCRAAEWAEHWFREGVARAEAAAVSRFPAAASCLTLASAERLERAAVAKERGRIERGLVRYDEVRHRRSVAALHARGLVQHAEAEEAAARVAVESHAVLRGLGVAAARVCGSVAVEELLERRLRLRPQLLLIDTLIKECERRFVLLSSELQSAAALLGVSSQLRRQVQRHWSAQRSNASARETAMRVDVLVDEAAARQRLLRGLERECRRVITSAAATAAVPLLMGLLPLHRAARGRHLLLAAQHKYMRIQRTRVSSWETVARRRFLGKYRVWATAQRHFPRLFNCVRLQESGRAGIVSTEMAAALELREDIACQSGVGGWSSVEVLERMARGNVLQEQGRVRSRLEQNGWRELYEGLRDAEAKAAAASRSSTADCVTLLLPEQDAPRAPGSTNLAAHGTVVEDEGRVWWLHFNTRPGAAAPADRPKSPANRASVQRRNTAPVKPQIKAPTPNCGGGTWFSTDVCGTHTQSSKAHTPRAPHCRNARRATQGTSAT